jgi:hypothetical protein
VGGLDSNGLVDSSAPGTQGWVAEIHHVSLSVQRSSISVQRNSILFNVTPSLFNVTPCFSHAIVALLAFAASSLTLARLVMQGMTHVQSRHRTWTRGVMKCIKRGVNRRRLDGRVVIVAVAPFNPRIQHQPRLAAAGRTARLQII